VLLSVAIGIPAEFELVRCELSEEIGAYFSYFV
jgi:hypothetical protein